MTAVVNLELDKGTNQEVEIDWTDPSTGLPIDITGYTAVLKIREKVNSVDTLIELSTTEGSIVLGGATGVITLKFVPADTTTANWHMAVYDLFLTDSFGVVTRVTKGFVTLSHNITT